MKGDFYYTGLAVYIDDALFPFLSATNGSKRSQRARAIAAKTFLCTATDRIVICVNYISLSIRVLF